MMIQHLNLALANELCFKPQCSNVKGLALTSMYTSLMPSPLYTYTQKMLFFLHKGVRHETSTYTTDVVSLHNSSLPGWAS